MTKEPGDSQKASASDSAASRKPRKRWGEMTKEERGEYIKRNPRVMYLWIAGFSGLMALFFFGLAQVQDQPAYLTYDKRTRPLIWMSIMIAMALYASWKAWKSPKGEA